MGLLADLLAMALLIVSGFVEQDGSSAYGLLPAATAGLGVGFGLTVPAPDTFAAADHPDAVLPAISGFAPIVAASMGPLSSAVAGQRPEPVSLHPRQA